MEIFCNAFRQLTGAQLAPQDAEPLLKMAQSRGFQEGPFAAVTDVVLGTPNIPDWLLEVQIEEISSMQRVVEGNTPCLRGDYVTAAVEGHGDVPTVVEASLRGIPADQLPLIFDPFYRVNKARSRRDGGAGLGLALCRLICERHGGTISAESEVGRGTTVTAVILQLDDNSRTI